MSFIEAVQQASDKLNDQLAQERRNAVLDATMLIRQQLERVMRERIDWEQNDSVLVLTDKDGNKMRFKLGAADRLQIMCFPIDRNAEWITLAPPQPTTSSEPRPKTQPSLIHIAKLGHPFIAPHGVGK